jgi:hypothetical protein
MRSCVILTAIAAFFVAARVEAGHFCQHCGCQRNCRKVCRLVCETKKEKKTEYSSECEDFCLPGPSRKCGVHFHCDCNGAHRKIIWQPTGCAKVHTRKTLVKEEVSKEVPSYKWVVDEYCCVCGQWIKVDKDAKDGDDSKGAQSKGPAADQGGGAPRYGIAAGPQPMIEDKVEEFERPPLPLAMLRQQRPRADASVESYYAYYLGSESQHPKPEANQGLVSRLADEETGAGEVEMDESEHEPRRLFLGLFGR